MLGAVFIATNSVGALPLLIGIGLKGMSDPGSVTEYAANPNDLSLLGIDANIGLIMMLFPFIAGLVTFMFLTRPLHGKTTIQVINGTNKIRWSRFFISFFVWFLLGLIYFLLYLKADPANFSLNNKTYTLIILILVCIFFIPFQTAFEEIIFRGYLMQGFTVISGNRWIPLLLTSVFFGLLHSFNPEVKTFGFLTMMPQYILFGLIFGLITIMDDGVEAAMGAHTANNIFLCIFVTNESSALQTPALYEQHIIYPWSEFLAFIVMGILFILVLKRLFKWESYSVLISGVKKAGSTYIS